MTQKTNQTNVQNYKRGIELYSRLCEGLEELQSDCPNKTAKEMNKEILAAKEEIMTSHFAELQEMF